MAGLAGLVSGTDWESRPLLEGMAESLRFCSGTRADYWNDTRVGLCRLGIQTDNRRPQPIFSRDGTRCIIFFGECFGCEDTKRNLSRQGYAFKLDDNDAEFVLRLYEAYGEEGFSQLNGSFCFAIYDNKRRELLLVNDRLGSRPLFYGSTSGNRFAFSTQVAAVLCVPGISRDIDKAAAIEFCSLQRVLGDRTLHLEVRMLPPGSVLRYREGRQSIAHYWYPEYRPEPGSLAGYADELSQTMSQALGRITRGNGRVAMLLSGGLDARMAVAAADGKLVCYTFGDYENPEVQAARRVAEAGGCEWRFLRRHPDHYADMVDMAVEMGNGMHAFNHAHALGFIEPIAEECCVVTHGFVPELLFRGYSLPKVPRQVLGIKLGSRLDPTLSESNLPERIYRRGYSLLGKGIKELFAPEAQEIFEETLLESARNVIGEAESHARHVYDQFLWPDVFYHARYPSMLFELSLRHFMTERSLVFHNEVIDLHLRLPVSLRADKRLWLAAMERLNPRVAHAADANTGHSPFLPAFAESSLDGAKRLGHRIPLFWRFAASRGTSPGEQAEKRGLSPISWPRFDWMIRNNRKLRGLITETLEDPEALPAEIFDRRRVQALLEEHLENRGQHRVILFVLLTFGRWHKKHAAA